MKLLESILDFLATLWKAIFGKGSVILDQWPMIDPTIISWKCKPIKDSSMLHQLKYVFITKNGNWDNVPDWAKKFQNDTLGGDHHVFACCLDKDGNAIKGKSFILSWSTGQDVFVSDDDGWANLPVAGHNWQPLINEGGYTVEPFKGEKFTGWDLPYNWHWSLFLVWQEEKIS